MLSNISGRRQIRIIFPAEIKIINRRLNYRNHRKLMIIDDALATWVDSMLPENIWDEEKIWILAGYPSSHHGR
jgi:phosphatidylserine/phosphatidylglycerophosphate/cardiolipin synthase-like enzyme